MNIQTFLWGKYGGEKVNNNILKTLRIEKGETQIEIARLLGLKTASAYSKKESGKVPLSLEEVKILADHYGKTIEFFAHKLS